MIERAAAALVAAIFGSNFGTGAEKARAAAAAAATTCATIIEQGVNNKKDNDRC